jgi:hypothetical protein
MRPLLLNLLQISFFFVMAVSHAHGQQPAGPLRDVWPGSTARIRIHSSEIIEGVVLHVRPDTMIISPSAGPRAISISQMDSLWIRGTHVRSGTIVGAVAGAAIGMALGVVVARGNCDAGQDCTGGYFLAIPLGAAVLSLPGALAGSLVGSLMPNWHLRFP